MSHLLVFGCFPFCLFLFSLFCHEILLTWLSSFVSQVTLSSFCRFINSLLPTLSLPHKHWTPSHLLHCLIDPQPYSSILVWISNPQSCGSNCWYFLFLSLSLQWVWSWMAVQKFEPTSKNCQVQLTIKASYYYLLFNYDSFSVL